jgi:cell division transport system permease protein
MERTKRKKILGGYPAVGVIISTTLALFVFGLFANMMIYSKQFSVIVRDNINIKVYLKSSLTETQRNQLEQTISSKPFVSTIDKPITFISKEQAEKDLVDQIGDFKEVLGENPLKDAFIVKIKPELQDTTNLKVIKEEVEGLNGVLEVNYERGLLDAVNKNIKSLSIYLLIISVLLIATVFMLVNNTLKLALFSQRFLIRSMQLVGARQSFIQVPFLVRALGYGIVSGLLAAVMIFILSDYAQSRFPELLMLHNQEDFTLLLASLLAIGGVISAASTYFAIRKYLKMSLDDLY